MKRSRNIGKFAKGAGAVAICLVALDLIATIITIAIGSEFLHI